MELLYVFGYYKEKAAILVIESEFHISNQKNHNFSLVKKKKNLLNLYLVHLFGFCLFLFSLFLFLMIGWLQ